MDTKNYDLIVFDGGNAISIAIDGISSKLLTGYADVELG